MTGIYYPYITSPAKWEELRYSLRSIAKNMQGDYKVFVVGDLPEWANNITHIPLAAKHGVGALGDTLHKLQYFLDSPHCPDEFIRMYDDVYLLRPVSVEELKVTRYLYKGLGTLALRIGHGSGSDAWKNQLYRTLVALKKSGYSEYMTETHCPELFEKGKMQEVISRFGAKENGLLVSTLYYNVFPFQKYICDRKTERVLFYGDEDDYSNSSVDVERKAEGKYYLNHNNIGLNDELKRFIENTFTGKSRFEK